MGRLERYRYRFLAALLPALVLAATGLGPPVPVSPARGAQTGLTRPNILLIVTDDQRRGTMSMMPAVRRYFEKKGRDYNNAFATSPLCCPSRASIMTGRYPHNHGVRRNEDADKLVQETTVQYYLQRAGYRTAIAGKYLNSWPEATEPPPYFDRWATIDDSNYNEVYKDFTVNLDGDVFTSRGYSTRFIGRRSAEFLRDLESEDDTPWFLYVAPFASHKPFTPERRYRDAPTITWRGNPATGEADRTDKPPWVRERFVTLSGARAIARQQGRSLISVGDMVDQLFETLTALDEKRDTLAVFISDNGYMWGEHGLASKRFPYTTAIRVPLFLRWPGVITRSDDESIVANVDVAPTLLEAAGVVPDAAQPMDGRSLLSGDPRERALFEFFGSRVGKDLPAWASLRSSTYQYIEYYDPVTGVVEFTEYYDLIADPFQLNNLLADDNPANDPPAAVLALELQQARDCSGADCP